MTNKNECEHEETCHRWIEEHQECIPIAKVEEIHRKHCRVFRMEDGMGCRDGVLDCNELAELKSTLEKVFEK